jgi:hypothetical protein
VLRPIGQLALCVVCLLIFSGCQSGQSIGQSVTVNPLSGSLTSAPQGNGESTNGEGPVGVAVRCQPVGSSVITTLFIAKDPSTGNLTASFDLTENDQNRTVPPFAVNEIDSSTNTEYQSPPFLLKLSLPTTRTDGLYQSEVQAIVDGNSIDVPLLCGIIPQGGISQ